jgi:hypothetical protein
MGAMTDIRAGLCAAYAIHQVFGSRGSWLVPGFAALVDDEEFSLGSSLWFMLSPTIHKFEIKFTHS